MDSYGLNLKTKIKGFYHFNATETKKIESIFNLLEEPLERLNYRKMVFPTIGLEEDLEKEKNHFKFNPEVFKIKDKNWFLKPTSEAIVYPITYSNHALKLPFKWASIAPAFRNESKACTKKAREREIPFFYECHGIFSSKEECDSEVNTILSIYSRFLEKCGIPFIVSKRPLEDTFPGAEVTYAFDTIVENEFLQIATVHNLGQNFSKAYRKNDHLYGICFGITERILGAIEKLYKEESVYILNPYAIIKVNLAEKKSCIDLPIKSVFLDRFDKQSIERIQAEYNPIFTVKEGMNQNSEEELVYYNSKEHLKLKNITEVTAWIKEKNQDLKKEIKQSFEDNLKNFSVSELKTLGERANLPETILRDFYIYK